jgi:hypothetical protein
MKMKKTKVRKHSLLIIVAIIFLTGVLTPLIGDHIRRFIIEPFIFIALVVQLFIESLPDALIWTVFIAILSLGGLYLITGLVKRSDTKKKVRKISGPKFGRLGELSEMIEAAWGGEYFRWRARRELGNIAAELLVREEGLSPKEAQRLLRLGKWPNQELGSFFSRGFESRPRSLLDLIRPQDREFERKLEEIITFLEVYHKGINQRGM